jgi:pimeloyl-ACP methyl ester carboxylesterase
VTDAEAFGHRLTLTVPPAGADEPPRPSAVFLHGMGMGADVWFPLQEALAGQLRTSFLTLPWDGNQGALWGRAAEPAAWVEAGLALLPSTPDLVVAHSFAANALLEYLAGPARRLAGAARPQAVVLVSPFYKADPEVVEWRVLSHHVNRFFDLLQEGLEVSAGQARTDPGTRAAVAAKVRERVGVYGWYEFLRLLLRTPFLDLGALTLPVLVLGGAADIACEAGDCERLAAALPQGRAALSPAAGHFCMAQDAGWFVRSLRELVDSLAGAPPEVAASTGPFPL